MIEELIKKARSYRRFDESFKIDKSELLEIVKNLRFISSPKNAQPLKYIISTDDALNERIFDTLKWAAYLREWDGPKKGQRPTAYIVILRDLNISSDNYYIFDAGIAIQTIMLQLAEKGLGGCSIAAIDREKLSKILSLNDNFEIVCVEAIGKPAENVVICDVKNGDIRYFRDENGTHFVPKRSVDELIVRVYG